MGQNFLFDEKIINKIVNIIKGNADGHNILEIGPGLGSISKEIVTFADNYLAIELDKRMSDYLIKEGVFKPSHLINADALKIDWKCLFKNSLPVLMVGNLPYSISTLLIGKFIKSNKINKAIIMVQKEMADRVCAPINSCNYNGFSVFLQSNLIVKKEFLINASVFLPQPKVQSALITLIKKPLANDADSNQYQNFLKICFLQRRKTLLNNLKNYFNVEKIDKAFQQLAIPLMIRPQELSPKLFHDLYEAINN